MGQQKSTSHGEEYGDNVHEVAQIPEAKVVQGPSQQGTEPDGDAQDPKGEHQGQVMGVALEMVLWEPLFQ